MSWYIIYKKTNSKKRKNKKICEEVFWRRFILRSVDIYESYDTARSFINYIWKNSKKPSYINKDYLKEKYLEICRLKNLEPTDIDSKLKYIEEQFYKYQHHKNYTCIFSDKKKRGENILQIPKFDLSRRKALGYKWTAKEEVYATIKHFIIHSITPGNQWTMINTKNMNILQKEGYNIEVFGSPFNTRLRYFGSLYDCDEPFGRVGTYEQILDKVEAGEAVMWRDEIVIEAKQASARPIIFTNQIKLLLSPPSGKFILTDLLERSIRIMKTRNAEIYYGVPAYDSSYLNKLIKTEYKKYVTDYIVVDKSWDFYSKESIKHLEDKPIIVGTVYREKKLKDTQIEGLIEIDMKGREWHYIIMRSVAEDI